MFYKRFFNVLQCRFDRMKLGKYFDREGDINLKRKNILKNLDYFMKIQSDTGTKQETDIEQTLYEHLASMAYFRQEDTFGKYKVKNDDHNREIVWALVRGNSDKTVILIHHHDAVDINDYGTMKKWAFDNDELKKKLQQEQLNPEIQADLLSEHWMFGRGSCDMKAGMSIQLDLLESYSAREKREGNILLLSVPDEETLSAGMRSAAYLLCELRDEYGLSYQLAINSEPHHREDPANPTIYEGSVGKTMLAIYVRGKKSHIGDVMNGFNPSLILSDIILSTEINPDLCDHGETLTSPPPSWSFARDFKECYDASIPESAGGYLSFLTMTKSPEETIEGMKVICQESMERCIRKYNKSYEEIYGRESPYGYQGHVKTYGELLEDSKQKGEQGLKELLAGVFQEIKSLLAKDEITIPESNFKIIQALLDYVKYNKPTVVIAVSPPYYPHISNCQIPQLSSKVKDLFSFICEESQKSFSTKPTAMEFFMGISDLSYLNVQDYQQTVPIIENNMPLWGELFYDIPFREMEELNIPVVNIGPWGKDLHKYTERVYLPDVEEYVPDIIESVIDYMLKDK